MWLQAWFLDGFVVGLWSLCGRPVVGLWSLLWSPSPLGVEQWVPQRCLLTVIACQAHESELVDKRQTFLELDTERVGFLTRAEVVKGFKSHNIVMQENDIDELMQAFDVDGSAKIH